MKLLGTAERKKREKEQRREAIVDAAEVIILKRGFEEATMDEIAEQAELSKGTLYLYFKNKTALYLAIYERGSRMLNGIFSKILMSDRTGIELTRAIGENYLKFVRENPIYFNAFIHYESISDSDFLTNNKMAIKCRENVRQTMSIITRTLQIGMQDGTIDDSYDPKELAIMIWASTRGIVQVAHLKQMGHEFKILDNTEMNIDTMFASFIHFLGNGMAKK